MSEDLLNKFISEIEQEEGVADARRRAKAAKRDTRRGQGALRREQAAIELKAASRGAVRLPADQAYLETAPAERNQSKGVCLIDEARSRQAVDHTARTLAYMKYSAGKLAMTKDAVQTVVKHHGRALVKTRNLRAERDKITCLREPKKDRNGKVLKKKASGSVFSDKDFARLAKSSTKGEQMQIIKSRESVFL
ncbi:hypothetical protein PRIPAC_70402 [Pristionchus pacificus]|uniref:Uncharacterized protein n=1 Tax=Pristionchus pacificus TaxID=54126 RepID=A0A2A6C5T6_PRIPA|nr:hypothetical protein PRIPAC_70402 [Pristionchus pacificus]|eukprot:PDM73458.1 hypothetical protein PRIPAC_40814 [Pristionchus pacificus]